jgi:hypothetical protein
MTVSSDFPTRTSWRRRIRPAGQASAAGRFRWSAVSWSLAVATLAGVVLLVPGRGAVAPRLVLGSGAVWLSTRAYGSVSLIDGVSGGFQASFRAAETGDDISTVRGAGGSYLVNNTAGTVSFLSDATNEMGSAYRFGVPGGGIRVVTSGDELFVVDDERRTVTPVAPRTLTVRGPSFALLDRPASVLVDASGTFWMTSPENTRLQWFANGTQGFLEGLATEGANLVDAGGRAAVVDSAAGRAYWLSTPSGLRSEGLNDWTCLDTGGLPAKVLGASDGAIYAAVSERGLLTRSGKDADDCGPATNLGDPGAQYGDLIEQSGHVFIPDLSSGETHVVLVAPQQLTRIANVPVVERGHRFELIGKDGIAFYNDLESGSAGTFRRDGTTWVLGTSLVKFRDDLPPTEIPPEPEDPLASSSGSLDPAALSESSSSETSSSETSSSSPLDTTEASATSTPSAPSSTTATSSVRTTTTRPATSSAPSGTSSAPSHAPTTTVPSASSPTTTAESTPTTEPPTTSPTTTTPTTDPTFTGPTFTGPTLTIPTLTLVPTLDPTFTRVTPTLPTTLTFPGPISTLTPQVPVLPEVGGICCAG